MILQPIKCSFVQVRTIMVLAALVCLCFSSNVGPRFLPLPVISIGLVASSSVHPGKNPLARLAVESAGFRVPMVSQTQKRPARETQQLQPIAVALKDYLVLPNEVQFLAAPNGPDFVFSCLPVPHFLGRAPPASLQQ